jgi:heme/copper-type cytochrome/quinol oxidase subunit 2
VKFIISATEGAHGFQLFSPDFQSLINITAALGPTPIERTVVLATSGNYVYVCTRSTCGDGHTGMNGELQVGAGATSHGAAPGH